MVAFSNWLLVVAITAGFGAFGYKVYNGFFSYDHVYENSDSDVDYTIKRQTSKSNRRKQAFVSKNDLAKQKSKSQRATKNQDRVHSYSNRVATYNRESSYSEYKKHNTISR